MNKKNPKNVVSFIRRNHLMKAVLKVIETATTVIVIVMVKNLKDMSSALVRVDTELENHIYIQKDVVISVVIPILIMTIFLLITMRIRHPLHLHLYLLLHPLRMIRYPLHLHLHLHFRLHLRLLCKGLSYNKSKLRSFNPWCFLIQRKQRN